MMATLSLPVVLLILSCLSCLPPLISSKPVDSVCFSMQGTWGEKKEPPGSCDVPNNASLTLTHNETHVNLTHRVNTDFCLKDNSCLTLTVAVHLTPSKGNLTLNLVKRGSTALPLKDWPKTATETKVGVDSESKVDTVNQVVADQQVVNNTIIIKYTVSRNITLGGVAADLVTEPWTLLISQHRELPHKSGGQLVIETLHTGTTEKLIFPEATSTNVEVTGSSPTPRGDEKGAPAGGGSSTTIYVAIGVVVLIAAVLVVLLLVYLFPRRRKAVRRTPLVNPK